MSNPAQTPPRPGRETRLLLVTIAVSIAVLLLLARFRFPEEPADRPVQPAPAPLERLAAAATYDELASVMADLERRIAPRVAIARWSSADGGSALSVAPRIAPDRAVMLTRPEGKLESPSAEAPLELVGQDEVNGLSVLRVPAVDDGVVTIRTATPRPGPRYLGFVEATANGPVLRPVYVARIQLVADGRTGSQQISLAGLQQPIPAGAAIFALDGAFVGLVRDSGETTTVLTGDFLRTAAASAPAPENRPRGSLGVELDALTPSLARASGADRGVAVAYVQPGGPAVKVLEPGDVIQTIDGTGVTTVAGFRRLEGTRTPGANVVLAGVRRGVPLELTIRAADAAAAGTSTTEGPGFVGRSVPGLGTEVLTLRSHGPAATAGLAPGDLILTIEGRQTPDIGAVAALYRAAAPGSALLMTIQRRGRHHVLALEKR
jgi:hypothetical protein